MNVMNVHRGYEGPRNEAFLSLRSRRLPRSTDDPPPPFVTNYNFFKIEYPNFWDNLYWRTSYLYENNVGYGIHGMQKS